jgi:autotransporter-associated beta strand protein/T5SS/PEP-CTERM-associated repeat protein
LSLTLWGDSSRPLVCGASADFSAARLILNDDWATDKLTLTNALVGETAADESFPALAVYTGAAEAVLENGATRLNLDKEGSGTLVLKGSDFEMGRVRPLGGNLIIAPPDGEETCRLTLAAFNSQTETPGAVVVSNAVITQSGASMTWYNNTDVMFAGCTMTSKNDWYPANRTMINGSTVSGGGTASLTLDNSDVTIDGELFVGYYSTANQNCSCEFIITNDATLTVNKAFYGRYGNVRQYSGHVKANYTGGGAMRLGSCGGYGSFHYHLYGGTLEHSRSGSTATFSIGFYENSNTSGNLHVYPGGLFISRGRNGFIGRYANNRGNLFVKGGTVQMTYSGAPLNIGYEGHGRLEVCNGGLVDINGAVIAVPTKAEINRTGFIELQTNGTVTARALYSTCTNDTAELTFDGGTFVAKAGARAPLISGFTQAYVGIGGGTIDTAGQDLAVEQNFAAREGQTWAARVGGDALQAAPAFTKEGAGTLTLTGTNTYACATCVSNGTLIAACEGALPETTTLRLGPGGTIDLGGESHTVANLIGAGTVANGALTVTGTVYPGHGGGTLTVMSDATLAVKKIAYTVAEDGTCGLLKVDGALDLTGVEITVDNPEAAKRGLRLVEAQSITGVPTCSLSGKYALTVSGGHLRLVRNGIQLIIR